jgi:hypothetical protein
LIGVSQPQLHNVLKGARKLHLPLADALLDYFQISLFDLFTNEELLSRTQPAAVLRAVNDGPLRLQLIHKPVRRSSENITTQREAS